MLYCYIFVNTHIVAESYLYATAYLYSYWTMEIIPMNDYRALSADYFSRCRKLNLSPDEITGALRDRWIRMRENVRLKSGGGGEAVEVADIIAKSYDGNFEWVAVLDRNGEVIAGMHAVCVLSDGSILDATADQFGEIEGNSLLLVHPNDSMMARYRPDFDEESNPYTVKEFSPWKEVWNGFPDAETGKLNTNTRGEGWWLDQQDFLTDYLEKQVSYSCKKCRQFSKESVFRSRLKDLSDQHMNRLLWTA